MKKISRAALGLFAATAILASGPAWAHAKLVASNPANSAVVQAAPKSITLTFNEKLVPAFSKFDVTMPEHGMKMPVKTSLSEDGKTLTGVPQQALPKGSYKIVWSAATADGHKMSGEVAFRIG